MSGDSKIGLPAVGGIVRTTPPRRIAGDSTAPADAPARVQAAPDALPVARLINMATDLASQGPPVDVSRVAALRTAIAGGQYAVHSSVVAGAMVEYHQSEAV